ncbi:MAG: M48 family peptidase, partial [Armatimonadetes bacterium]|nr:M48 family peptidase [Armatimonadota bacterium]
FGVLVAPVLVDPIYNRYTPLPDTPFRARILELAHSAGIRESAVFQVEMSHRTKSVNAYVTGLGGTARIVLWDTLLLRLSEEEALAVMAHEMGHYVERHVPIGLAGAVAGTLVLLLILDRLARAALHRWRNRWRVEGLDDLAMYPLYLALVIGLNFAASPVTCALSRVLESRADEFALRQTADPRDVASALVKLSENNLSDPRPPAFVEFWLFTHPPLQARIDRALTPR